MKIDDRQEKKRWAWNHPKSEAVKSLDVNYKNKQTISCPVNWKPHGKNSPLTKVTVNQGHLFDILIIYDYNQLSDTGQV